MSLRHFVVILVVTALALAGSVGLAQSPPGDIRVLTVQTSDGASGVVEVAQSPEFWIGIGGHAPDETLASQLGLEAGQGFVVDEVLAEGPAAQAGLEKHDVIVKIDDKVVHGLKDVTEAVQNAHEKELTIVVRRKGQEVVAQLKPEKRPEQFRNTLNAREFFELHGPGGANVFRWSPDDTGNLSMQWVGPGAIAFSTAEEKFPEGLSIQIKKESEKPAQIDVKRGDESWSVTDQELDKLPDDVRQHVDRLLGRRQFRVGGMMSGGNRGGGAGGSWFVPNGRGPRFDEFRNRFENRFNEFRQRRQGDAANEEGGQVEGRVEERLDDLTRRLEGLMEELRDLRRDAKPENPAANQPEQGQEGALKFDVKLAPAERGSI
jgi:hypothetical protein